MLFLIEVQQRAAGYHHRHGGYREQPDIGVARGPVAVEPLAAEGVEPEVGGIADGGADAHGRAGDAHRHLGLGYRRIHAAARSAHYGGEQHAD